MRERITCQDLNEFDLARLVVVDVMTPEGCAAYHIAGAILFSVF